MNLKHSLSILILSLCVIMLWGQYDEKAILTQQATNLYNSRQYAQAEQLYRQILQKWESDQHSILQLLNISYATGDVDKAEAVLSEYGRHLAPITILDHEIQILVHRGRAEEAWAKAMQSMQLNPNDQNRYRTLASHFQRRGFFDQVLELYEMGRISFGNPDLFTLEYANAALAFQRYDLAMAEYLRWLEKNPGNLYFVNNQCKQILDADSTRIEQIRESAKTGVPVMRELLASTLVSRKMHQEALEIYKEMGRDKMHNFANEQMRNFNDDIAVLAYEWLAETEADIFRKMQYVYNQAQIGVRNQHYALADSLVNVVIADSLFNLPGNRWRSGVGYQVRQLKAKLSLITSRDPLLALSWVQQTKEFARNQLENQQCDLEAARLQILARDYPAATSLLGTVTESGLREEKEYFAFLAALLADNMEVADSLMNDYVINWPGGSYTNDAIYLMMHTLGLQGEGRAEFMEAFRLQQLYDPAAISILQELFEASGDEELLILAVEWALGMGDKELAQELLQHEWGDDVAKDYAALLTLFLQDKDEARQREAREFLRHNPNSVFSPSFRSFLAQELRGRPN